MTVDPDAVILPGLVDSHVHICDPGTDWEGFASATAAAAAGGITTLVDMPIDSFPATVDLTAWHEAPGHGGTASGRRCHLGRPRAAEPRQIDALLDAGVVGFKCFLVDPGSPDFEAVDDEVLMRALAATAHTGVPVMVHAEDFTGAPPRQLKPTL